MPAMGAARHAEEAPSTSIVCKLRLKPDCPSLDNVLKQPQVMEVLSNEYVAQYLEHIGARPSKAAADLVRANAPLTAACVKACFKAQGVAEDELVLTAPAVQLDKAVRALVPRQQGEQIAAVLEAVKQIRASTPAEERLQSSQQASTSAANTEKESARVKYGFQGMAAAKLYPFNLEVTLAKTAQAEKAAVGARAGSLMARMKTAAASGGMSTHTVQAHPTSTGGAAPAALAQWSSAHAVPAGTTAVLTQDAMTELLQEFKPGYEAVLVAQEAFGFSLQQWFEGLSPGVTQGQVCGEDVAATAALLASNEVIKLAITLMNWLYCDYVVGSPVFPGNGVQHSVPGARRAPAARPWMAHKGGQHPKAHGRPPEHYDLGLQVLTQQDMERAAAGPEACTSSPIPGSARDLRSREASMPGTRVSVPGTMRGSSSGVAPYSMSLPLRDAAGSSQRPALPSAGSDRTVSPRWHGAPGQARHHPSYNGSVSGFQPSCGGSAASAGAQRRNFARQYSAVSSASSAGGTGGAGGLEASLAASLSTPRGMRRLQQCRLVAILQQWQQLQDGLKRSRVGLFFSLPVVLLSLRSLSEHLFANAFTAWLRSPHGAAAAAAMDAALLQLLDPSGHHSQMPLLQSTPAAVRLCQSFPRRWHAQELGHYHDISTALVAALGEPASAGARRMLTQQREGLQEGGCGVKRAGCGKVGRLQLSSKLDQEGQVALLQHTLQAKQGAANDLRLLGATGAPQRQS